MRSTRSTRGDHLVVLFSLSLFGGGVASVACGSGGGDTTSTPTYADGAPVLVGDDAAGDDDSATPYMGPTSGGTIFAPDPDEAGSFAPAMPVADGATDVVDSTCCNLTFTFDPSTLSDDAGSASNASDAGDDDDAGDDGGPADAGGPVAPYMPTSVSLVGDAYPLSNGAAIPMTHVNGLWTATACVPPSEYLRYRYYLGQVPIDPTGMNDATAPAYACDPNASQVSDGLGGCYNTFGPVTACSDVDASVGMVSNVP